GNVFTLAGVPSIVQGMLGDIGHRLERGIVVQSITVRVAGLREGDIAEQLSGLDKELDGVNMGSYPWFRSVTDHGVALVARSRDETKLRAARERLIALVSKDGRDVEVIDGEAT
ncbi:MAG: competence/damage-inducible protein A, partial [Henriciella sp.]